MVSFIPFDSSRQRVERADAHSDVFAREWNRFIEDDPYSSSLRMNDDGTGTLSVWPNYPSLPTIFSLELGEILYQLRAALDGCVYDAAILDSGKNPPPDEENLEFPLCCSPAKFKNSRTKIRPLKKKRRDIIKSVQPYNAPKLEPELMVFNFNRALGILHEWARRDRHRQLHVVGSWVSNARPQLRFPSGVTLEYMRVNASGFLEHESEIASFKLSGYAPEMNVQGNPYLGIDIAVDEVPPPCADSDTLGNRLLAMSKAVKVIVGAFKESFGI